MVQMKNSRTKGVSPVIAALLLIAISVAASLLTFTFVNSLVKNQSAQAQTGIRIDDIRFVNTTGTVGGTANTAVSIFIVSVRNTGSVDAIMKSVKLEGKDKDDKVQTWTTDKFEHILPPASVARLALVSSSSLTLAEATTILTADPSAIQAVTTPALSFAPSRSYKVTATSDNGFTSEGAFSSPSTLPKD